MADLVSQTSDDGSLAYVWFANGANQSFFLPNGDTIESVSLYMARIDGYAGSDMTVTISNPPYGVVSTASVDPSGWSTSLEWHDIDMPDWTKNAAFVSIGVSCGDSDTRVYWAADSTNPYGDGVMGGLRSTGGPIPNTWDAAFIIRGTAGASAPSKPTNPSPADGSGPGVDFSDWTFSWDDGGGADEFTLYAGDSAVTLNSVVTQAGTSYQIPVGSAFRISLLGDTIYWRVDATNNEGTTTGDVWSFDPRPAKVTNPSPADSASDQSVNIASLSWDASAVADDYDVYFGETLSPITISTAATSTTDHDPPLTWSTTYTWRVDPGNEFGTTTGDEWTFTTLTRDWPRVSARYVADDSVVPAGTEFDSSTMYMTGENFMATLARLIAAAGDAIWYETPG